jgi:hypothetical protein
VWVNLGVLLFAQLFFSLLNTNSFKNCYLKITREKTAVLGSLLREDIEFIKGHNNTSLTPAIHEPPPNTQN